MRKSVIACVAVALVFAGGLVALLKPIHCPVNRAALGRIEEGMTQAEVYAVLGGPPGDYRTRPPAPPLLMSNFRSGPLCLTEVWKGDEGTLTVGYDFADVKVMFANFEDAEPYRPGLVELARWRLERLREAWLP
jgi:hypothetical protein